MGKSCVLVSSEGKIELTTSEHGDLGSDISVETYIVNRDKLMVSESRFLKDAVLKTRVDTFGVNEGLTGKRGVSIYPDYRNIPVVGAWYPIKYTNWVLLAEIDEEEAFAPLRANRINQGILVSITVIMVVVIAIFSAHATTKPVQELIEVSMHIAEGKLDKEVKIQSYDEIGILINVFNEMIKNMRLLAKQAVVISKGDLTTNVEAKGEGAANKMVGLVGESPILTIVRSGQVAISGVWGGNDPYGSPEVNGQSAKQKCLSRSDTGV